MSHTTQCPSCQTKFKVSDAHLALAGGMVRCGRCSHVFHAPSHFDAAGDTPAAPLAPQPSPAAAPVTAPPRPAEDDDFELELPDFEPAPVTPQVIAPQPQPVPSPFDDILPDSPLPDTDFDLPDFDLLEQQREAARQAPPPPAAQPIVSDFRAAAAQAEANAGSSNKDMDAFQQALSEALRTPASSGNNRKLSAYVQPQEEAPDLDVEPPDDKPAATSQRQEPVFSAALDEEAGDEPVALSRHRPAYEADEEEEDTTRPPSGGNALKTTAFALLGIVLSLALLGQVLFINRTRVSAEAPELRPAFESLCASLGCSVPLPTDRQLIRTEWSELSFVPQNDHLIQLNATLKNLANYPQAFPLMELTLKDAEDKVVIRKVFRPEEYIPATDLKLGQFNGNSELKVQLRMAMAQGKALGYSLHFYYP